MKILINANAPFADLIDRAHNDNNLQIIKNLIDAGANLNVLFWLVGNKGNLEFLKILINENVNVDCIDTMGNTLLGKACEENNLSLIEILINAGANVNCIFKPTSYVHSKFPKTLLCWAYENNNLELIKILVSAKVELSCKNSDGNTLLGEACIKNNLELVKILVDAKADVNCTVDVKCETDVDFTNAYKIIPYRINRSDVRSSVLTLACANGNLELVKILIKAKTDISCNEAADLLSHACSSGKLELVQFLTNTFDKYINEESYKQILNNCLRWAYGKENLGLMKILISAKADVNAYDSNGLTLLAKACGAWVLDRFDKQIYACVTYHRCNLEVIKCLVESGADIIYKDPMGKRTILMFAVATKSYDIVEYLINKMTLNQINEINLAGETALALACQTNQIALINRLLSLWC